MAGAYSFEDIADLIGLPVTEWPASILAAYQKPSYTADDRFKLCLFNYVNGFDNRIFLEYALARGALRNQQAVQDVLRISGILSRQQSYLRQWYSFNLAHRRWMYLDGSTKHY